MSNCQIFFEICGILAGFFSTISLFPQIYKTCKSKSSGDLSWMMIITIILSAIFWVVYGVYLESISIWLTNVIMLISSIVLGYYKFRYN